MAFWDGFVNLLADAITSRLSKLAEPIKAARDYREGRQKRNIKNKPGQFDDNLTVNFSGLIVDRSISDMLGDGVTFDLPGEGETNESKYIDAVWDANKRPILLSRAAMLAADGGTGYLKIQPEALEVEEGKYLPRLIALDPALVTMDSLPNDFDTVIRYTIEYKYTGADGKERAHRQVHEHVAPDVAQDGSQSGGNTWVIIDYELEPGKSIWTEVDRRSWDYPFADIVHWQNLPDPINVYGDPELAPDLRELQDKVNFAISNLGKIVRFYAHPQRFSRMAGDVAKISVGPDEMPNFNDPNGGILQLEQMGDLAGSLGYLKFLRQALFDISRTVDIDSLADKLGALTNFALKVLYKDALAKIDTKRELMGDALKEINRRLLILAGMNPDPGKVVWPDVLPIDEVADQTAIKGDLEAGLVSKQTASEMRGYDWEVEQERMDAEKTAGGNIGEFLLNSFNRGGGPTNLFGNNQQAQAPNQQQANNVPVP